MIKNLDNLALFWVKNANFFANLIGENIYKIKTSAPGCFQFYAPLAIISSILSKPILLDQTA
jgi:hypothetical protein